MQARGGRGGHRPQTHAPASRAAHHNRVLQQGVRRAERLEPRLAAVLEPILRKAGEEAAGAFQRLATDFAAATTASATPGVVSTSTMVALKPRPAEADALEHQQIPADELHCTLCYLGEVEGDLSPVVAAVAQAAASHAPLEGTVAGIAAFEDNGNGHPAILLPSVPGLVELRVAVTEALAAQRIDYSRSYGYVPHMTVHYASADESGYIAFPSVGSLGRPLHFDAVYVVRGGDEVHRIPLTGATPVTASAAGSPLTQADIADFLASRPDALTAAGKKTRDHGGWATPAPDELVDVQALVETLRTKTDPVRQAVVESVMAAALGNVGVEYDTTNPFTNKVLAQSGSQIKDIAATTQANVMRIIRAAYEEGLTIPDTAKAIRAGMADASKARATLIARTELAGAVNGGSVAATQIVSEATGIPYTKTWKTSVGATYPRHEDYDGLNGQTVDLDATFDVGGVELEFPGDPNGPPDEICNCRCTVIYTEAAGEETEEDAG